MKLDKLNNQFSYIKYLISFSKKGILLLIILSLITGLFESLGISTLFSLVENFFSNNNTSKNEIPGFNFITEIFNIEANFQNTLIIFVILILLKALFKFLSGFCNNKISTDMIKKIRQKLISRFLNVDYKFFSSQDTGDLSNKITVETQNTISAFIYLSGLLVNFFTGFAFIVYLFILNWKFSITAILFGIIYISLFLRLNKFIKKNSIEITKSNSMFNSLLIQTIQSFKYLKSTFSEYKLKIKLDNVLEHIRNRQFKVGVLNSFINSIQEPLIISLLFLIVFVNVNFYLIPILDSLLLIVILYKASVYFMAAQSGWATYLSKSGGIYAIKNFDNLFIENKEIVNGKLIPNFKHSIKFSNVSFSYVANNIVLNKINLEINKNTSIAFVGESGSGKSTLVNMLTGLLKPDSGEIFLDDKNFNDIEIHKWREKIGYVTQESVIFNDTIKNNITLWSNEKIDKLNGSIKKSKSKEFIENIGGVERNIGDRGILLSGGQKQRISLARELYKDIDLLILDEATSALDSVSEQYIKSEIDSLKGELTLIIIAHRISTIEDVDYIYCLDNGKIVEEGTYKDLIEKKNYFYKLTKMQSKQILNV